MHFQKVKIYTHNTYRHNNMAGNTIFVLVPAFLLLLAVQPDLSNAQEGRFCRIKSARADLTVFTDAAKGVSGFMDIQSEGTAGDNFTVTVHVQGLVKGAPHGFHIHEVGNTDQNCTMAGGHFNPTKQTHGFFDNPTRHVGDICNNVVGNDDGVFHFVHKFSFFTDPNAPTLCSDANNVNTRSVVLHAMMDDGGLTDAAMSKTNGNSGARIACGIIKITQLFQIHS